MSWVFGPGGGSTTTPGGADKDIQFNNNGSFSGSALLTTDGSGSLSASVHVSASTYYGDGSNLTGITASAVQVADGPEYSIQFRRDAPVSGEISGSVNLRTNAALDHVFLTGTLYVQGQNAYFGNGSGGGFLRVNGDTDTHIQFGPTTGGDSMDFVAGGKRLIRLDENGADMVILGSAASDTIYTSGSLTASVGMRVSASAAIGEDIVVGSGKTRTIGVLIDGPDDFFVMGHDAGAVTLSASSGVEFVGGSEGVGSFGSDIKVFATQAGNTAKVTLSTSGDISGSGNVTGSALYGVNAFVSSIPADRVLVSTTNGKITSHSPFTFSSDVLSVPTITASVGISSSLLIVEPTSGSLAGPGSYLGLNANNQIIVTSSAGGGGTPGGNNTEVQINDGGAFGGDSTFTFNKTTNVLSVPTVTASVGVMVTSSTNGSINIGEGISYTFGGNGRLDVFENEFRLNKTSFYQAMFPEQTSNFNIENAQVFLVDTNGSVVTGSLPAVSSGDDVGITFTIKDSGGNAGTNDIVIEPNGSQKIDGASAAKITANYGAITVVGLSSSVNGFGWGIISAT